ncbi:type II toxin-antitoxin system RelE family toxin [Nostoc sp.]|uniref:type II toxin-antitoxin system RelE family toxin n=1 Tax=Nostoc sp. TaxID=1180 RepID=UPI003FA57C3D
MGVRFKEKLSTLLTITSTLNPRPEDAYLLKDTEHLYKVRLGEYRIIYQIQDQPLLLIVIKIAHLKDY